MSPPATRAVVTESYDRVAERYAEQFFDELRCKPLDRALLGAFAELVGPDGSMLSLELHDASLAGITAF